MTIAALRHALVVPLLVAVGAVGVDGADGCATAAPAEGTPVELPPVVYIPADHTGADLLAPGVVVPYAAVGTLWDALGHAPVTPAPAAGVLASFALVGTVDGDVLSLGCTGEAVAVTDGWSTLALPAGWSLQHFSAADARLALQRTANALCLHLPGAGRFAFTTTIDVPIERDNDGTCAVTLPLPEAAVGTLDLTLPGHVSDLRVDPALAHTLVPSGDRTRLTVTVGSGAASLAIRWHAPQDDVGQPVVLVQERVQARISTQSLREEIQADIDVVRNRIPDVTFTVPAGLLLLAVDGPTVRSWDAARDRLVVHLTQPLQGTEQLHLSLEQSLAAAAPGSRTRTLLGVPSLLSAERTTGSIHLVADGEEPPVLTLEDHPGVTRIDPRTLGQEAGVAVAFLTPPPPLAVEVERRLPEVEATELQVLRIGTDEDRLELRIALEVRDAGIYGCSCDVPQDWELVEVEGSGLAIASSRLTAVAPGLRRLQIAFRNRVLGEAAVRVRLRAPPSIPRTASGTLLLGTRQALSLREARTTRGTLAVLAPPGWALSASDLTGCSGEDRETVAQEGPVAAMLARDADAVLALAFSWRSALEGPAVAPSARLQAVLRPREVDLREEEAIAVGDGDLHQLVDWRGDVRYSALPSLQLRAPTGWEDQVVIAGEGIADHRIVGRDHGLSTWEVRFDRPVLGRFHLQLDRHQALASLATHGERALVVPSPEVVDHARLQHVVAITRIGPLAISASDDGLAALAAGDVPATLAGAGIVAAFQGAIAGAVHLHLAPREDLRLADASITAASYRAVLGADGVLRVEGVLHLEDRGRPSLALGLPAQARLLDLVVDGLQGHVVRQPDGAILVPLPPSEQAGGVRAIAVALVYEQPLAVAPLTWHGHLGFTLPTVGDDGQGDPLPVEQVWAQVFVPDALCPLTWHGDLSPRTAPLPEGLRDGAANLSVHLGDLGQPTVFERLGAGGTLRLRFLSVQALGLLSACSALVGLVAGLWLGRRRPAFPALVVLLAAIAGATASLGWSLAAAVPILALGAGAALVVAVQLLRAWARRPRPSLAASSSTVDDDPWLAGGAPATGSAAVLPSAPAPPPVAGSAVPPPPGAIDPAAPDAPAPPTDPGAGPA